MHKSVEEIVEQLIGDLSLYSDKNTAILVEDREDIAFWRRILQEYAPHVKPDFPIFSTSGKGNLKQYFNYVSKQLFICVDSDNDAYHQTIFSEWLHPRKPFIYQTYAHSRESHFIHPNNLKQYCEGIIAIEHDFYPDFVKLSEVLYEWLIFYLFFKDKERKHLGKSIENFGSEISWEALKNIIKKAFEESHFEQAETLDEVRNLSTQFKIQTLAHKEHLQSLIRENGYDYLFDELQEFQRQCLIEPSDTLWFIQGHCAFDDIILPYFDKTMQILSKNLVESAKSKEERNRWKKISDPSKSYRDALSLYYVNCLSPSQQCRFFKQIQEDMQNDFLK